MTVQDGSWPAMGQDGAQGQGAGEAVGAGDAEADRVASGAPSEDAGALEGRQDSDGVPVGRADADADVEASGADPGRP